MVCRALHASVMHRRDLVFAGCAIDAEQGLRLCHSLRPELVLVNVDAPRIDGLALIRRLAEEIPGIRLLAVSSCLDPYLVWQVLRSGAHGFIDSSQHLETILDAIRIVADGGTSFSPAFESIRVSQLADADAFYKILSDREQAVLFKVAAGWNDERIGAQLGIAPSTVEVHRKHMRQKLNLHNDRDLVAYAHRWGLTVPKEKARRHGACPFASASRSTRTAVEFLIPS